MKQSEKAAGAPTPSGPKNEAAVRKPLDADGTTRAAGGDEVSSALDADESAPPARTLGPRYKLEDFARMLGIGIGGPS